MEGAEGALVFTGRMLALLTAHEAVEKFLCEEYGQSIRYVQSALTAQGAIFGEPQPLSPSPLTVLDQKKRENAFTPESRLQLNFLFLILVHCGNRGSLVKTKAKAKTTGVRTFSLPVDTLPSTGSCTEFPLAFETLLDWSHSKQACRGKPAGNSCFTMKDGRLVRRKISHGEKRFLIRLHDTEKATASHQSIIQPVYQIQDMQMHMNKLMQTLSSKQSVGALLRIAPGPRVARHRVLCMSALLEHYKSMPQATSLVDLKGRRISSKTVNVYDHLWLYKEPGVASIIRQNPILLNVTHAGTITYNRPEQLSRIGDLIHQMHTVLIRSYLEATIADLISETFRDEKGLLHCKLAHTILCKEGSGVLAIAKRSIENMNRISSARNRFQHDLLPGAAFLHSTSSKEHEFSS